MMVEWQTDDLADVLCGNSAPKVPVDACMGHDYLTFISNHIDSWEKKLRPLNLKIHDNPELCYEEFIAHEAFVEFLRNWPGWEVTPSAYNIQTAFIAVYDSGKPGPVVSFNAEYGNSAHINIVGIALT
jgi:hypothetical protein